MRFEFKWKNSVSVIYFSFFYVEHLLQRQQQQQHHKQVCKQTGIQIYTPYFIIKGMAKERARGKKRTTIEMYGLIAVTRNHSNKERK